MSEDEADSGRDFFFVQNFNGKIEQRRQPIFVTNLSFVARQHPLRKRPQFHESAKMIE